MATYRVKKGDTLSAIAKKYSTSVEKIMSLNKFIKNKNLISVGWVLTLPEQDDTPEPVTPPAAATPDFKKLGEAVNACLQDINALPSFNAVMELIGNGIKN